MTIIAYNTKEPNLFAKLMKAKATSEGNLKMLVVSNSEINRIIENYLNFKNITSIYQMVYKNLGEFSSTDSLLFSC